MVVLGYRKLKSNFMISEFFLKAPNFISNPKCPLHDGEAKFRNYPWHFSSAFLFRHFSQQVDGRWSFRDFSIVFVDRDDLRKNMCSSPKLLTFLVFPHLHCTHGNSHPNASNSTLPSNRKNLTPTNQHVNLQHVSTTSNRNQLLNCTFTITTTK